MYCYHTTVRHLFIGGVHQHTDFIDLEDETDVSAFHLGMSYSKLFLPLQSLKPFLSTATRMRRFVAFMIVYPLNWIVPTLKHLISRRSCYSRPRNQLLQMTPAQMYFFRLFNLFSVFLMIPPGVTLLPSSTLTLPLRYPTSSSKESIPLVMPQVGSLPFPKEHNSSRLLLISRNTLSFSHVDFIAT